MVQAFLSGSIRVMDSELCMHKREGKKAAEIKQEKTAEAKIEKWNVVARQQATA
jgi:hypothetical protein